MRNLLLLAVLFATTLTYLSADAPKGAKPLPFKYQGRQWEYARLSESQGSNSAMFMLHLPNSSTLVVSSKGDENTPAIASVGIKLAKEWNPWIAKNLHGGDKMYGSLLPGDTKFLSSLGVGNLLGKAGFELVSVQRTNLDDGSTVYYYFKRLVEGNPQQSNRTRFDFSRGNVTGAGVTTNKLLDGITFHPVEGNAQAQEDGVNLLLRKLVEKGVLTQKEADDLHAESQKEPPPKP